ncbi:hypothetical protein HD554DRAFT_2038241 [Boletus coccyginus]|nr:hypothetical protein HD554DRAFT_2038241 [Boletus coccyginus]
MELYGCQSVPPHGSFPAEVQEHGAWFFGSFFGSAPVDSVHIKAEKKEEQESCIIVLETVQLSTYASRTFVGNFAWSISQITVVAAVIAHGYDYIFAAITSDIPSHKKWNLNRYIALLARNLGIFYVLPHCFPLACRFPNGTSNMEFGPANTPSYQKRDPEPVQSSDASDAWLSDGKSGVCNGDNQCCNGHVQDPRGWRVQGIDSALDGWDVSGQRIILTLAYEVASHGSLGFISVCVQRTERVRNPISSVPLPLAAITPDTPSHKKWNPNRYIAPLARNPGTFYFVLNVIPNLFSLLTLPTHG